MSGWIFELCLYGMLALVLGYMGFMLVFSKHEHARRSAVQALPRRFERRAAERQERRARGSQLAKDNDERRQAPRR